MCVLLTSVQRVRCLLRSKHHFAVYRGALTRSPLQGVHCTLKQSNPESTMLSDSRGSAHTQIRGWVFTEFTGLSGFSDTCTEVVCLVHQPWSAARQTRLLDVAGLLIFHLFIPTDSQKHFLKIWHCSWTWEPSKKPIKGFTVFLQNVHRKIQSRSRGCKAC